MVSAGVGAAFGIGTSVLMELVKPAINRWNGRRTARKELLAELKQNMEAIYGVHEFLTTLGEAEGLQLKAACHLASSAMISMQLKQFQRLVSDKKEDVYALTFYSEMAAMYDQAERISNEAIQDFDIGTSACLIGRIEITGNKILRDNGIVMEPRETTAEALFNVYLRMEQRLAAER